MSRFFTMISALAVCGFAGTLGMSGSQAASPVSPDTGAKTVTTPPESQTPVGAQAVLEPTAASAGGTQASGTLSLTADHQGVRIAGAIKGLKPGAEHGFHIHEKGDCSAPDASSAGAHFNPSGAPHGKPGAGAHHLGDLMSLRADAKGAAQVDVRLSGVTLGSAQANNIVGKSIVVHEKPDDYKSQPAGNSGNRIACGVIR